MDKIGIFLFTNPKRLFFINLEDTRTHKTVYNRRGADGHFN